MAYNDDIFRAQAEEWAAAIHNVNFPGRHCAGVRGLC